MEDFELKWRAFNLGAQCGLARKKYKVFSVTNISKSPYQVYDREGSPEGKVLYNANYGMSWIRIKTDYTSTGKKIKRHLIYFFWCTGFQFLDLFLPEK